MKKYISFLFWVLCGLLWYGNLLAQNAITFWKDGVPTIVYSPDSIFFWNSELYALETPDGNSEGEAAEPTETEQMIMGMTSVEENAPMVVYSEEDSIKYEAMAQEIIGLFAHDGEHEASLMLKKSEPVNDDYWAQEAIRNNGSNIFSNLVIEQQDWNSGTWGKTRYGGFETYYNTHWEDGKRCLLVVFYYKGGFPNRKTAYLKLGQVNSGKVIAKTSIAVGREYVFLNICIDDYLHNYGCVNFFPLLITEDSKARNYLNPFFVKSDPIVPDGWEDFDYGSEFGKINGVSVYCNTLIDPATGKAAIDSKTGRALKNISGIEYQCVELCKRYVKELNSNISRKLSDLWGNAINWPENRANDDKDLGKYIVYPNDGSEQVREGDLIVWSYGKYGHIGVVIKTTENYISVAHQNGGSGKNALPIGSTMKKENGIIKDIKPGSNNSPIFATSHPINYLIRMYSSAEDIDSYSSAMSASTTNMDFGSVDIGRSVTKSFKIVNRGFSMLAISSISLSKGECFTVDASNCTVENGANRTFKVTFTPTRSGEFKDRIIIRSDAEDNPVWVIHLNGSGNDGTLSTDLPKDGLVAYYPFNGTANDESGNGNHGSVIGNVELTSDRYGHTNSAYRFFGEPFNYISVPDNESLHLSTFTLNAWVYTDGDNYGTGGYLINKGRDIIDGTYGLTVTSVRGENMYGGENGAHVEEIPPVKLWHMVTGTIDGDKSQFYIDGVLMDERTLSNSFVYNNSDPLTLGMHFYSNVPSIWTYSLRGVLDDVRIYNRVLTSSEINALYKE